MGKKTKRVFYRPNYAREKKEGKMRQSNMTGTYKFAYLNQYDQCFIQNNFEKCILFKINLIIDPLAKLENKRQKNLMICTNHIAYNPTICLYKLFAQTI